MFDLKNVTFSYDSANIILDDVSMKIEKGVAAAITGANGCGKTTLLRLLNGLSFPNKGKYFFDGTEITRKKISDIRFAKEFHRRVGFVFQSADAQLFCGSVEDEIAFGPRQLNLEESEIRTRVDDRLSLLEITRLRFRAPYSLSGGEKRRVAFACVLALNPDALVVDEPLASLDASGQSIVMDLFQTLRDAGKTIVFASHSDALVNKVADVAFNIEKGV